MRKLLKYSTIVLASILVITTVGILLLANFVSPNRLKPLITTQVQQSTGKQLTIDGDLSWSFFPTIGIKVGHMSLSNLAEIDSATIGVKLLPLLHGEIESSGIRFDGMKLNLIKNKQGQVNWNFATAKKSTTGAIDYEADNTTTQPSSHAPAMALGIIARVDIANTQITFNDQQAGKTYVIKNFNLHAQNIELNKPFPLNVKFDLISKELTTPVNLSGDITLNLDQHTLAWNPLKANAANISLTGKVNVAHFNTSPVVKAEISIPELQAAKIKLQTVKLNANYQNNLLNISSLTAQLYQGSLNGQARVNLKSATPQISLQTTLSKVQAAPLMQDLGAVNDKLKITGLMNANLQVTTSGNNANHILQNLNGNAKFNFDNGDLEGVDLGYLIDSAYALAKQKSMPDRNSNKTHFGTLTASAVIKNGVLNNQDLLLDSPRFETHGNGSIDLVKQRINYGLKTTVKKRNNTDKDDIKDLYGMAIPVNITGNLNDPTVRLDTSSIMQAIAQRQMQNMQDKVQEKIKDKFQEQAAALLGNVLGQ